MLIGETKTSTARLGAHKALHPGVPRLVFPSIDPWIPRHPRLFIVSGDDIREIWRDTLPEAAAATAGGFVSTGLRHMKAGDGKQVLALVDAEKADIFVTVEAHAGLARRDG